MKIIGITGGVGCGKSTVLDLLVNNFNAYVIKADEVGRSVLEKGGAAYLKVVAEFGPSVIDTEGNIDRAKLAGIVFNDSRKLSVLNSIEHPIIKKIILDDIARVAKLSKYDYIFVEAALIYEDDYDSFCDEVWYVYADERVRRLRLKESRNYSDEKISQIMKSQLDENEFKRRCDRVIDNTASDTQTLDQIKKILVEG